MHSRKYARLENSCIEVGQAHLKMFMHYDYDKQVRPASQGIDFYGEPDIGQLNAAVRI